MPSGVTSADKLGPDGFFRGLFVGPKSAGKTVAACSFYKDKKVLDLDFDGRIRGILGVPWLDKSKIDYKYFPPRAGLQSIPTYQAANSFLEEVLNESIMGISPYGTIICDSATAICRTLLQDAVPLTHSDKKGKKIGTMSLAGPEDYGFESTGFHGLLSFMRSLPMNMIVTAHLVPKFAKADPDDPYSPSIEVGQKLSLRDKIGADIGIYFDHIFEFDRRIVGKEERFFFQARSSVATTSFSQSALPVGEFDITGINFYEKLMSRVGKEGFPAGNAEAAVKLQEVASK